MNYPLLFRHAALAAGVFLPCWLLAQTSASQIAPAADDEVITLEAFTVKSSTRNGDYIASEAMSGTRTGSRIIDIPSNVQVITRDMMEDFQLTNAYNWFPTVPNYSSGTNSDDRFDTNDSGAQRLRGFAPVIMRDGFTRAAPTNISNIKQVEVIMGPQSALYGQASPGGILNYVSKRPRRSQWNRLTLAIGDYGNRHTEIEVNGPAIKDKLFYMFDVAYDFHKGETDFSQLDTRSYLAGITCLITPRTSLSVNWEQQFIKPLQSPGAPQLVVGSTPSSSNPAGTGGTAVGPYFTRRNFNRLGPYQDKSSRFDSLSVLLEQAFNKIFSARLNTLYYHRGWDDKTWTSGLQLDQSTMRMRARQPMKRLQSVDDYAVQGEMLAQFETAQLKHKLLFTGDFTRDIYDNRQWLLPTSGANSIDKVLSLATRYLDPFNPTWETLDYGLVTRLNTDLKRVYDHQGLGASLRTFALGDRLVTSLSARYSRTDGDIENRATPAQSGESTGDGWIYSFGVNYRLHGDAAVFYANTSTSYEPSVTYDIGLGRPIAPEKGRGVEIGIKGSFLDNKFNYTVSLYDITKRNVRESNPNYDNTVRGSPQYLTTGQIRARGGEVAASYAPVPGWTLIATFGSTDAEVTHDDPANKPSRLGKQPLYVPEYTASFLTSYRFSDGPLRGVRFRVNTTYQGEILSQYASLASSLSTSEYYTPPLFLASAGASYDIKQGRRLQHSISLDVHNLLDKEYFIAGNFTPGRGRSHSLTYRLNF